MWSDNQTTRDFLNFTGVADTVAEIVVQAQGRPISIGVSGAWGVGKSSMIDLTRVSLERRAAEESGDEEGENGEGRFVFVNFNAWLYQGYDDARAALMDVIATTLEKEAERRKTGGDKLAALVKRIRWLRVVKLVGPSLLSMGMGLGPVGTAGTLVDATRKIVGGGGEEADVDAVGEQLGKTKETFGDLLGPALESSPPKEIQALRDAFESTLEALGVTLVVLIDDLDRCLPETTISTLEAIRLFLFLEGTAFVIAADDDMIKHAVRHHFGDMQDDRLVTSYFDKLIQIPIQVPPLGTQEVRAYLLLLFVENSALPREQKERVRVAVVERLREAWRGIGVSATFVIEHCEGAETDAFKAQLDLAERLTPIMTSAEGIAGNPRLIKRFLNALSIRTSMASAQKIDVDEAVLAKLLLFERLSRPTLYAALVAAVAADAEGMPHALLDEFERQARDETAEMEAPWNTPALREWLCLDPPFARVDLRGALYISREHAPIIVNAAELTAAGRAVLEEMLTRIGRGEAHREALLPLPPTDRALIMGTLLDKARREPANAFPTILVDCLVVAALDEEAGQRLILFLKSLAPERIQPGLVPRLEGRPWAADVLDTWRGGAVSAPVKRAIDEALKHGNIDL